MKAVIVDIQGSYTVALDKKGDFIKIRKKSNHKIGYEVELTSVSALQFKVAAKVASMAAVLLILLGVGIGSYCYALPYTYVNVDINPGIEITANLFNRIIKVDGINDDGKKLLEKVHSRNKSIKNGIEDILAAAVSKGYLKDKKTSAVLFTVSGKSEAKVEKLQNEIEITVANEIKTEKITADVLVQQVSLKKHDAARKTGVSPGKQVLIDKLIQLGSSEKADDLQKAPVKQLVQEVKALKSVNSVTDKGKTVNTGANKKDLNRDKTVQQGKTSASEQRKDTGIKGNVPEKKAQNGNSKASGKGTINNRSKQDGNSKIEDKHGNSKTVDEDIGNPIKNKSGKVSGNKQKTDTTYESSENQSSIGENDTGTTTVSSDITGEINSGDENKGSDDNSKGKNDLNKGDKGDKENKGDKGDKGDNGNNGSNGNNGKNNINGKK